jgi:hypothetical protein
MSQRTLATITLLATVAVTAMFAAPATAESLPLVAYWPMIEGRGQVIHDFSGNRNNGVMGASTAVEPSDPTWIAGGLFGALRFAGGQFVTVPDSPSLEPQKVSVLALVRGSTSPGTYRYVVSKGAMGCTTASYGLYTGSNGGMAFYVYNGVNYEVSPEAQPSIWNGKWHVVAGTYDGSTVRLFVDGAEVGSGTTALPASIAYGLPTQDGGLIGAYDGGSCSDDFTFVGDIDEVSIWRAALPMSQILPREQALLSSRLR